MKDHTKDARPDARLNTNYTHNHIKDLVKYANLSRTLCKGAKEIQESEPEKDLTATLTAIP
ncbi:19440_t:CDS:1, partial [Gigaspora margarita]